MGEKELIKRAIELCLAVYRVTDKFPVNEILREKLRSAALEIVESIIEDTNSTPTNGFGRFFNYKKIKKILACFSIAGQQNWVNGRNFEILRDAYNVFYHDNRNKKNDTEKEKKRRTKVGKRQKEIVQYLAQHKEGANLIKLAEVLKLSKRSISRELRDLIDRGIVKKQGVTKSAKFIMALL